MSEPSCHACVYSFWDRGQWLANTWSFFGVRPVCANHPDAPALLRPTPADEVCRNYRARCPTPDLSDGSVKTIPVAGGYYAYVDAADYEWLSRYKGYLHGGRYAARREKGKMIPMHRDILHTPPGQVVDHANGNGMDNTRRNIRNCSPQENGRNPGKFNGTASRYKGVGWHDPSGKWVARIWYDGRLRSLGYHHLEQDAARAYDRKAVECFRDFAWLNFPDEWPPDCRQVLYAEHPNGPEFPDGRKMRWQKRKKQDAPSLNPQSEIG